MPTLHWFIVITLIGVILATLHKLFWEYIREHIRNLLSWILMCTIGVIVAFFLRRMQYEKEEKKILPRTKLDNPPPHKTKKRRRRRRRRKHR